MSRRWARPRMYFVQINLKAKKKKRKNKEKNLIIVFSFEADHYYNDDNHDYGLFNIQMAI